MTPPAGRASRVVLGQVCGAHGLRGQIRVRLFGESGENLLSATEVALSGEPDQAGRVYEVERGGPGRAGEVRLALRDVSSREAAEALRGLLVLGDPADLAPLGDGEHYWHELVGCEVFRRAGEPVGRVSGLLETGAHDVLVVERPDAPAVLVPAVEALLHEVDPEAGRIVLDEIPGLLED